MSISILIENGKDEQVAGSGTVARAQIELERFATLESVLGRFLVHKDMDRLRKDLDAMAVKTKTAYDKQRHEEENSFPYGR